MNRFKQAILATLLLAMASVARATDPVNIETKWNSKLFSISTTGVTAVTLDIGGFGATGYAILGAKYTANGVDGTTYGATLTVTTNTTNVVGFSWSTLSVGGDASLKITQLVKTPAPRGSANAATFGFNSPVPMANNITVPLISTSTTITIPNGVPLSGTFEALTANPVFIFTGLTSAATLYFTTSYGIPRVQ